MQTIAAALLTSFAFVHPAMGQSPAEVKVISFPGGANWPLWAAQERGEFERNGLRITLTYTPNSVFLMTGLIEGRFDIGIAAIDNLIAYQEGQGEAKVEGEIDLIAIMGTNNGFNSLMAAPRVKDVADLKGRKVSVDAMTTGYAFVLFDILRRSGLQKGDYVVERAGGAGRRWEALRDGKHDATLLSLPWDVIAEENGFKRIATSADVGRLQGSVAAVRRKWAASNETLMVAFIRAYVAGYNWLADPGNRAEAIVLLHRNIKGMTPELAETSYRILLDPRVGLQRKAAIDIEGVRKVLELRSEFGVPRKMLTDPLKYYEPRYYLKAVGTLEGPRARN